MTAFRDAMVRACVGREMHNGQTDADAVLASPEMQAIRAFTRSVVSAVPGPFSREELADWCGLPESVIEWVMS